MVWGRLSQSLELQFHLTSVTRNLLSLNYAIKTHPMVITEHNIRECCYKIQGYQPYVHGLALSCNNCMNFVFNVAVVIIALVECLTSVLQDIAVCINKRLREKKRKRISEQYDKLVQVCHNKIEEIQPVIQECEMLIAH